MLPAQPDVLQPCGARASLLVLIVSCFHHSDQWPQLREWAHRVRGAAQVHILAGNESMGTAFLLSSGTLIVRASDAYDSLPVKMASAYNSVVSAAALRDVTHVLKVDDTDVLDGDWDHMDVPTMEEGLAQLQGDYMTNYCGYVLSTCTRRFPCALRWHMQHVQKGSYWDNRPYMATHTMAYADGGSGYIVSRRSLSAVAKRWPLSRMAELYHKEILEDYMLATTLFDAGIEATVVDFPAIRAWSHRPGSDFRKSCSPSETAFDCSRAMSTSLSDLNAGFRLSKRCGGKRDINHTAFFSSICTTGGAQVMCSQLNASRASQLGSAWMAIREDFCQQSPGELERLCAQPDAPRSSDPCP